MAESKKKPPIDESKYCGRVDMEEIDKEIFHNMNNAHKEIEKLPSKYDVKKGHYFHDTDPAKADE